MSVSKIFNRLYAFAGIKDEIALRPDPVVEFIGRSGWDNLASMRWRLDGVTELRNILFWIVALVVLIVCGKLSISPSPAAP